MTEKEIIELVVGLREKYRIADIQHFTKTGEKSKKLRGKVSVLDELFNHLGVKDKDRVPKKNYNN